MKPNSGDARRSRTVGNVLLMKGGLYLLALVNASRDKEMEIHPVRLCRISVNEVTNDSFDSRLEVLLVLKSPFTGSELKVRFVILELSKDVFDYDLDVITTGVIKRVEWSVLDCRFFGFY